MATFELLSSVTVGSSAPATIEFTSIPQTYTDLCIYFSGRTTANGDNYGEIDISFNGGPSGTSYAWDTVQGNTGGAGNVASATSNSDSAIQSRGINGSGSTANSFSSGRFYIPNYTSNTFKSITTDTVTTNNANNQVILEELAGLLANTSAITSVRLTITYGTAFASSSTAYLYGISNA